MPRKRKPKERRSPGTGYIRETKNGRFKAHYPNGAGGYIVKTHDRQEDAQRWLVELAAQAKDNIQIGSGRQLLSTWLDTWLTVRANDPDEPLKLKTQEDYRFKLGYPSALIGHLPLADVTIDHVDAAMLKIRAKLAPTTSAQIRNLLRQAFDEAVRRRYITHNPATPAKRRKKKAQRRQAPHLSAQQAAALLEATTDRRLKLILWLMLCLPLRSGEVLGLRRVDLDLAQCTLTIAQSAGDLRGKVHIDTPKTADSRRTLPFPSALLPDLIAQLDENLRCAKEYARWHEHMLVFPSRAGTPQNQSNFLSLVKDAYEAAKLDRSMGAHHLRHTASALLTALEAPEVVRAALAGHTPSLTNYYGPPNLPTLRRWVEAVYAEVSGAIAEQRRKSA